MVKMLYGLEIRDKHKENIKQEVLNLPFIPHLKIIVAEGYEQASSVYVNNKKKFCNEVGVDYEVINLEWQNKNKQEVLSNIIDLINIYNEDDSVTAYFFQMPLPYGIVENDFIRYIKPEKDADGFHPLNLAGLYKKYECIPACTPQGIMDLFDYYNIELSGKDVVIVNRSQLVGIPLAAMLINKNATVQVCHSHTKDLKSKVKQADIVVTAVGKANFMDSSWFRNGQVIIDVSINRDEKGKLVGDVNKKVYKSRKDLSITPVPKGVGSLTVMELINNIIKCAKMQSK